MKLKIEVFKDAWIKYTVSGRIYFIFYEGA